MAIRIYKHYLVSALVFIFSFASLWSQTVTFTQTNVTCNGASDGTITMTLSGGSSSYRYVIYKFFDPSVSDSFGPTGNLSHVFTGLDPDWYSVFVRDITTDAVLGLATLQITQPAVLNATVNSTNVTCYNGNNGTITISGPTGGSGAYEYTINGGSSWQTSGSFSGLTAGNYTVQIRDRNATGCVITLRAPLTITQPLQLNATLNYTDVTCFGKNNGTIVITSPVGGSGSYQYSRNGGSSWQAGGTFTALPPGTYNVVMRDAAAPSCTRTLNAALVIAQPAQLRVDDITIVKGLTCNESSDGQLRAIVSGGTTPYTYDWYVNPSGSWVSIGQYNQTATGLTKGWYEVRVNDANNCGVPTPASGGEYFLEGFTDSIPPVFVFDSASVVNTCQGQTNGSITIYAHGGKTPYTYSITAGGASGYQLPNLFSNLAAGNYETWTLDKKGCKKSGPVKTIATTPNSPVSVTISANPSGSICPGTSVLFTATPVNGGTTPAYQWRLNGSPVGVGGATYTNSTLVNGDQVRVVLTSSLRCTTGNPATSNTITAALLIPPSISSHPASVAQCAGTNVTFSVTASGSGITYQWRKNGTNIGGATGSTYTLNNIIPADAGNYTVVVTGTCGNVTSNIATLTVNTAPVITVQPVSIAQCVGTNATFSVTATGTGLTYQWRKGGINIGGATGSTYTINNINASHAGSYDVVITGTCGNITSNAATLTVNTPPAITAQPVSIVQCTGTNATFSVTATGTGLTYQWRKGGTNIGGATGSTYTINNINASHAGSYDVVITGTCGNITSNAATLTVNLPPSITAQPASIAQCVGTNATFSVTATGAGLTYQWRKGGVNIGGATGSTYTINNINATHAGNYDVVITGTCGNITSNVATLTVNTAPAITTQPANLSQCAGTNATFSVIATGAGLTYQWRKNGTNIGGATGSTYTINNITAGDAGNYDVVITGTCGSLTSNAASLTINTPPSITAQPVSIAQCAGTNATFSVTALGSGLSYQWRKNGTNIAGATATSYTRNNITAGDAGNYDVVITGTCGILTSAVATLTVNTPPSITIQPAAVNACEGTNASFSVTAVGTGLTYQWRKNGVNIGGATGSVLTLTGITPLSAGNYDVIINGTCGNITSNAAALTVALNPVITAQPFDQQVCEGSNVTFSVTATGSGLSYQWRRNGANLTGQTSAILALIAVTPAQSGNYDVVVTGQCGTLTSVSAVLIVDPATAVLSSDNDTLVCEGSTVDFHIVANGLGALSYQWQWQYGGSWIDLTDGGDISGTATPDLSIQNVEVADTGYYRCFVSSACGSAYSTPVQLNVNHIVATIGTPAPFLINSATTTIQVGVHVTDRLLYWDLGFALVAPDGTEVTLKAPRPFLCVVPPNNNAVDVVFTTELDKASGDTIDWCVNTHLITGTFAATGDWSVLNGMDPANGAWQVRVYDSYNASSIFDGYLKLATLSFTDANYDGDTVTVRYNSGPINEEILNPIAGELRATSYVVPIRLMTSCFNTVDARAVVTVQGGIAPYTYQWTGPTVVPNVAQVDLGPGTYSVLVTDALGCSSTATVDVTAPPAIVFDDLQQTDSLACFGAADGIIRSKASGGSGPLTYTLLPGNMPSAVADSGVFLNLPAGDYTIRVTDINDCSFDTIIHIYQRPELVVQVVIVPVIGLNPGSITLTASGGTPPYQYSIDNGATLQPTGQFNNLPAGIYPVYVVDANGCTFTQNVNLTVNELDVTVTKHDVSCFGLADGSFYLATTDGVGPYTLTASWLSAPQTEPSGLFAYTGQSAGLYDIRIEDSQGWLFMDTIEIKEPTAIVVTANITNASCSAITKDGAIDITVTGGTGVYTFTWSNNAITEDLINIEAGKYTVAVNDENGCSSAYYEFEVLGINVATAYAGENDTICPGAEYQLIGSVGDSVSWEPAQLLDNPKITNPTATITTKTSFIYTVYDNGCVDKDTVVIDTYERIGMDIYDPSGEVDIDTALYLLEGETYTMAATPGFVSYLWDPPTYLSDPTLQAVVVAPANSLYYTVFGTTNKGCIETDRVHVVIARPIEIYSGFSPNGDGINDKWVITNGIQYGNRIRVKVFNRWGEPIFESKGYGASQEWDGTRNGRPMPVGAYYYIVDVNDGKSKPYTGTVTILR